jgi:hypothetical protein
MAGAAGAAGASSSKAAGAGPGAGSSPPAPSPGGSDAMHKPPKSGAGGGAESRNSEGFARKPWGNFFSCGSSRRRFDIFLAAMAVEQGSSGVGGGVGASLLLWGRVGLELSRRGEHIPCHERTRAGGSALDGHDLRGPKYSGTFCAKAPKRMRPVQIDPDTFYG